MPVLDNSSNDFFFEKREDPENILKTIVELVSQRLPKFTKVYLAYPLKFWGKILFCFGKDFFFIR